VLRALVSLVSLTIAVCACETSAEDQGAADTDISIQTTDIESLPVGAEAQCIERLTAVVDPGYLRDHDVEVADEASAGVAIEEAIADICSEADPESEVHEAAHEVVHEVEERLK
jgi:hypothetical protein